MGVTAVYHVFDWPQPAMAHVFDHMFVGSRIF
jgi:hypothetical protein